MNLDQWCRLGDWHDAVRDAFSQLLPSTTGDANRETLEALRARILGAFEQLRSDLIAQMADRDVNRLLLPLVLLVDEKVLTRIRAVDRQYWPLLQRTLYNVENGGDLFYELVDEQLGSGANAAGLGEILLFCLSDGFRGRYGESPARIQAYRTKLANLVGHTEMPLPVETPEQELAPLDATIFEAPSVTRRVIFYSLTGVLIIAMPLVFVWLSNFFSVNG